MNMLGFMEWWKPETQGKPLPQEKDQQQTQTTSDEAESGNDIWAPRVGDEFFHLWSIELRANTVLLWF